MKYYFAFLAIIAILACAGSVRAAGSVTVGDPKQPGSLAQAVQDAYTHGVRKIVIRPGACFLPDVGHTAITLEGWKDAAVSGYGGGAILVHGDGAAGNRDFLIRNNRFFANYQSDLDVQWADGVTLAGNVMVGAPVCRPLFRFRHRFRWRILMP